MPLSFSKLSVELSIHFNENKSKKRKIVPPKIDVEKLNEEIYHYDEGKYCLDEEIHGDDEKVTDGDYFEDKRAGEYQDAKVCDFEERQLDGDLDPRTGEGQYLQSYYVGLDDRRRADGNQDRDIELCGGDNCGERKVDEGQYLQFYDGDIDYKGTDEDQNDNEESSGYNDYSADDCIKSKLHIHEDDSDDFEDVGAYDPQEEEPGSCLEFLPIAKNDTYLKDSISP